MSRRFFVVGFAVLTVLVAACGGGGSDAASDSATGEVSGGARAPREESVGGTAVAPVVDGPLAPLDEQFFPGNGDGVAVFEATGGLVLVDFGYTGSSQFAVRVRPEGAAGDGELVVDTSGPWKGTLPLRFDAGRFEMAVTTDGVWFASVRHSAEELLVPGAYAVDSEIIGGWLMAAPELSAAAGVDQSLFFSGEGTTVSPPFHLEGTIAAALLHDGVGTVTVWLVDADGQFGELFTDLVGRVETSRALEVPAAEYRVAVRSAGTWTVAVGPR